MMNTRMLGIVGALLLLVCTSGCGEKQPEQLSIRVVTIAGHMINLIPTDIASHEGFFQRENVKPEFIYVRSGSEAAATLLSGSADAAVMSVDHIVKAAIQGKRLVLVGALNRYPGFSVVVRNGIGVETVEQLRGHTVATTGPGSATHMALMAALRAHGVDAGEVSTPSLSIDAMVAALRSGQIDGAVMLEPHTSAVIEQKIGRVIVDLASPEACEKVYGGEYVQAGIVVDPARAESKWAEITALVKAYDLALAWVQEQQASEIIGSLPAEVVAGEPARFERAMERLRFIFPSDTSVSAASMGRVIEVFRSQGVIQDSFAFSPSDLVDDSFGG